jgi:hypothetical protein
MWHERACVSKITWTGSGSTSRRLNEVIHAQTRVADLPPVRRSIGLLPGTSLIDILPRLAGMLDDLVGDPNRVAENDPMVITFAHGQQGYLVVRRVRCRDFIGAGTDHL